MLRWSHHVDIFGTLHFIVRCLADRSEGPLPPCSCRRRRCSCTPPASASSPTSAKDIESRPNHVNSWSPAREEPMDGAPFSLSPSCGSFCPLLPPTSRCCCRKGPRGLCVWMPLESPARRARVLEHTPAAQQKFILIASPLKCRTRKLKM